MFSIKRNQVIVTALVVMVAVAGYLNVQEGKINLSKKDSVSVQDDSDIVGTLFGDLSLATNDTDMVDGEIGIAVSPEDANIQEVLMQNADAQPLIAGEGIIASENAATEPGEAVFVNKSFDNSFFVQAKLEREQARSKSKDMLMEMLENKSVEKEQKALCADAILTLQKRIEKETSAEAMIEAKGFTQAYVRIDDETVDVVVNKEALSDVELAQIEDIVKRKTGVSADKIRISPLKS